MIQKHKIIEIDENNIFENDKLKRKETIKDLSLLLENTSESLVLSLNAPWGAGKTTFVKLWKTYLKKEKSINSIYFSAWEDDFSKEPLISIIGEIKKYINDNFNQNLEIESKFDKVKDLTGKVLKRGVPSFLKGMTGGLLDIDKGFEEAIGSIVESTSKELIDNYSKNKEIVEQFKNSIQDLLSQIDKSKPFIIFIDELDRCRPIYAIELLERIKHIFGIDGLIFVLSIDKVQLSESIKSQYGNIDADNYLRRFIDMEYSLQSLNTDDFCTYLYHDIFKLSEILVNKQISQHNGDELQMIKYLSKSTNLSLREIEQIFTQISIIYKIVPVRFFEIHFIIIIVLIVIKNKFPKEYELLKIQKISENELITLMVSRNIEDEYLKTVINAVVLATSKTTAELDNIVKAEKNKLDSLDIKSNEHYYKNNLISWLSEPLNRFNRYRLNEAIETVIKKIEFSDRFYFSDNE